MEPARLLATDLACRRGERLLFKGVAFALAPGEALQVTGPNGTGKSSLIRILAGLLRPLAGMVERTGAVALLDERLPLDTHPPLAGALHVWQRIDGTDYDLAGVGLETLAEVPARYLSTGQRKRAAILLATARGAPIWLLDEPLNGLDAAAAEAFQARVAGHLAAGGIAVIASHQRFAVPGLATLALADFAA